MATTPDSKITDIVDNMSEEQLRDYIKVCAAIDAFSREMKIRFAEKSEKGRVGWDNNVFDIPEEISERATRLADGDDKVNVGIANWAFIDWYSKNKNDLRKF